MGTVYRYYCRTSAGEPQVPVAGELVPVDDQSRGEQHPRAAAGAEWAGAGAETALAATASQGLLRLQVLQVVPLAVTPSRGEDSHAALRDTLTGSDTVVEQVSALALVSDRVSLSPARRALLVTLTGSSPPARRRHWQRRRAAQRAAPAARPVMVAAPTRTHAARRAGRDWRPPPASQWHWRSH